MLHITYPVTRHIPELLTVLCILMAAITQESVDWLYENEMDQEEVSLLVSTVLCLFMQVRLRMCGAVPQPLHLLCSIQL
jgi:hypothetical protein